MTIPPRFLDELRSRLTLSDIIGSKVRLTRAGREFKGCCPFHKEKTPSFTVNDDKQFYHCFGCGAHGSVIDFVMSHDNMSFIEAVEALAAQAGMQVPQSSPDDIKKAQKAKSLHALLEDAAKWMEAQLRAPENADAYKYITGRGVSEELLAAYRIGFAPAGRQALRTYMTAQGYTDAQMIEAGVLRPPGKSGEPYAFFRERVMFPVPDRRGRIVAFGGRILPDHLRTPDKGDYTPAKYMNSSDTPLFHKGRMLYGEPHARQAAQDGQPVIVVEGYLDVIACAKGGFRGAVAPLGTALTVEQIPVLWQMIPQAEKVPILCFDGDNAGRRAAARAVDNILPMLKPDHSARIAFLPDGQDPDSLINTHGARAFSAVLDGALSLVDFLWAQHTAGKNFSTPEAQAGLSALLEKEAQRIPDRDVQFYYRQAFREKIRQAFSGVFYGKKGKSAYSEGKTRAAALRRPAFARVNLIESALLACLINHPEMYENVEEQAGALSFNDKRLDRLRQLVLSTLSRHPGLDSEGLRAHLDNSGAGDDVKGVATQATYTHALFSRPQASLEIALEGWNNALQELEKMRADMDLNTALSTLADTMSADQEGRVFAMMEQRRQAGRNTDGT